MYKYTKIHPNGETETWVYHKKATVKSHDKNGKWVNSYYRLILKTKPIEIIKGGKNAILRQRSKCGNNAC